MSKAIECQPEHLHALQLFLEKGWSRQEICIALRIRQATFYRWKARLDETKERSDDED